MTDTPEWMNLDAWIEHTGRQFSRNHAKRGCQNGDLCCIKFGKVWLVHRDALNRLAGWNTPQNPPQQPSFGEFHQPRKQRRLLGRNDVIDIRQLHQTVREMRRADFERSEQWSLGKIIDALEAVSDKTRAVQFDFCGFTPLPLESYRGYYDELAFGYGDRKLTVREALAYCMTAVDTVFTGYKGGEFVMDRDTPVWVANWGCCSSTAVVGVRETKYDGVIIETSFVE